MFRRRKKDSELVDPEARSPELGLKYKDLLVLNQLMTHGGDLSRERHVVYYLYVPGRQPADAVAAELAGSGWTCGVRESEPDTSSDEGAGRGEWLVTCEQHDAVVSVDFVRASTDLMESVAARHGGHSDGWEASL